MEMTLLELFEKAPYLISFVAGALTFASPCVLPLIPAYLSYISGLSLAQLQEEKASAGRGTVRILEAALLFVAGFSLVFILLGAAMAELIGDFFHYPWVSWTAGGLIILFGLHTMGVVRLRFLNYQAHADFTHLEEKKRGVVKRILHALFPFLLGVSFALGWSPCIGPIFAAIVAMAADSGAEGVTLMAFYAAGLGVPFLLTALLTRRAMGVLNRIKRHFKAVEIFAGSLLVLIGLVIAGNKMGWLTAFVSGLFS